MHGHHFLHTALDGHSRLAYSELLTDERKETAAAFWIRANTWFAECGISVRKVLTDNGSCYRPRIFRDTLGDIEHVGLVAPAGPGLRAGPMVAVALPARPGSWASPERLAQSAN